jgi:hypothetical protein
MNTERRTQTALKNARRYSQLAMAREVAVSQTYWSPVLLGDDGRFWVPATTREAGLLIKAGYEVAA